MAISRVWAVLPGFIASIIIGFAIWYASALVSWIDPLVAGILFGIILRSIIGQRKFLEQGLDWTPKALIPPGIILYGAHLSFGFDVVSPQIWLQLLVGLVIVVWLARTVGKWLKIPDPTSMLLAVGTAICGASAIVIAADTVRAEKRDTTTSLVVITIWGLIGLALLPLLASRWDMNSADQALLYATTLHQTGLVKTAAAMAGGDVPSIAIAIKTARIFTIIPLLFIVGTLAYLPIMGTHVDRSSYKVRIPWYLWAFVISGLCFNFIPQLAVYTPPAHIINTIIWTMAMVSIGLTVDARTVLGSIGKPLLAGLIIWLGLLMVFFYTYLNS